MTRMPTCLAQEPDFGTPMAHLWRALLGPGAWQARATLSRGTGAQWLHLGLHPGFSSSRCPPLRWQHGVTQGQTPSSDASPAPSRAHPPQARPPPRYQEVKQQFTWGQSPP